MGKVSLNPYLFFRGNAKEAMEFYKGVFGGELTISTYGDMPGEESGGPEMANKVMHADLDNGEVRFFASDGTKASAKTAKVELSLSGDDEKKLRGYWEALSTNGKVNMALEKAPWGDHFGMLTDKFGVDWMVNINASSN